MNIIIIPVGSLGTNCYLLCSKAGGCAVIDPGAQAEKIMARIAEEKLEVKYILLTHGHHDHIGGVRRLSKEYPDAEVYIGKNDHEMLTDTSKSYAAMRYGQADDFIVDRARTVDDGQELVLDELTIRVMETPGHTRGGVCYVCDDVIFSGDTLFYRDVGRCDLYGGNYDVLKTSLKKLAALDGNYRVYPGHGDGTTLDFERAQNPYIAEALE